MKKTDFSPGKKIHGFTVEKIIELAELDSLGIGLKHDATGCRLFHIFNDDTENAFAFTFRTPPRTSNGVAHILEHSVLCGSESFPLKDPFLTLVKGSMNTYLNAWTFPDKTVYPAASINRTDYYNILRVYGDAVFFPLLRPESFAQEAWHLEPADTSAAGPLIASGVVFNEMKGNYSSQSSIVSEWTFRSLFPDTPYGVDSGGEPAAILDLTREELIDFHRAYYHPANCRILLYGDIPTDEQLLFLEKIFLSRFQPLVIESSLPLQRPWTAPRRTEKVFPAQPGEDLSRKTEVTVSWLLPECSDPLSLTAFSVLDEILAGNSGSPLRRALVESGLGQDYTSTGGLETDLRQMVYSTGLRGTDKESAEKIESLALETVARLVKHGIPKALAEAAFRLIEFNAREIAGGRTPFALKLFQRALRGWLHEAAPEATLLALPPLSLLKEKIKAEPRFLEKMLDIWLLKNQHRSLVIVTPDPEYLAKFEAGIGTEVKRREAGLDAAGRAGVKDALDRLHAFQEKPDSAEDVKKIPFLKRSDLPAVVALIESREEPLPDAAPLYHTPVFTNGIVYLDVAFRADSLPADLLPWLPLFGNAVCGSGLPGRHYAQVQNDLALLCGGFRARPDAALDLRTHSSPGHLIFRLKALETYFPPALALATDLLRRADFSDTPHLKDILLEARNGLAASVISGGSHHALLRAGRAFSPAVRLQELWSGLSQLVHLTRMRDNPDTAAISTALASIRTQLLAQGPAAVNLTAEASTYARVKPLVEEFVRSFGNGNGAPAAGPTGEPTAPRDEVLLAATGVSFSARVIPAAAYGTRENVIENALGRLLGAGKLHDLVRVKGGAYGANSFPYAAEGMFCFSSYRDPHIAPTLDAFEACLKQAARDGESAADLDKAVISIIAREEAPLRPGEKGFTSFRRRLYGIDDRIRQQNRDWVLGLQTDDLRTQAARLLETYAQGRTAVLTGRGAWEKTKGEHPELQFSETEITL